MQRFEQHIVQLNFQNKVDFANIIIIIIIVINIIIIIIIIFVTLKERLINFVNPIQDQQMFKMD